MNYTLPGTAETIQLPNYPASPPYQITGNANLPTQTAGSVMTIELSQNKFTNGSGQFPSVSGTVDFYTTLEFSESTSFGSGNSTSLLIPVTIISPCVVSGTTYTVTEESSGLTLYTETDTATQSGSVTGHVETALNPVPAKTVVYITVSH
jgi:hypothetical protein